jgi:hypothetical protein
MRALLAFGVASAAFLTAGAASAAEAKVEIRDAVARVVIVPEARSDVKVSFRTTNASLPLTVRVDGDRTIVDGDLDGPFGKGRIGNCRVVNGVASIDVSGVGRIAWEDMPRVVIQVPRDARVSAGGAVFGSVGRSASLTLSNAGCGDWTVANVAGALTVNLAGSGDLKAGSAGAADIRIAGSGDVATRGVRGKLEASIAGAGDLVSGPVGGALTLRTVGSGDADVASVNGDVDIDVAGAGDVLIRGGRAGAVSVNIAGSGQVQFAGAAESVNARIAGSGDIQVASVRGAVEKRVVGSGEVRVGPFTIDARD